MADTTIPKSADQPITETPASILDPPPSVVGMVALNRDQFTQTVCVPCLEIQGCKDLNPLIKSLKPFLIKVPQFKAIQHRGEH